MGYRYAEPHGGYYHDRFPLVRFRYFSSEQPAVVDCNVHEEYGVISREVCNEIMLTMPHDSWYWICFLDVYPNQCGYVHHCLRCESLCLEYHFSCYAVDFTTELLMSYVNDVR